MFNLRRDWTIAIAGVVRVDIWRCGGSCGSNSLHTLFQSFITPWIFKTDSNIRSKIIISWHWQILSSLLGWSKCINEYRFLLIFKMEKIAISTLNFYRYVIAVTIGYHHALLFFHYDVCPPLMLEFTLWSRNSIKVIK